MRADLCDAASPRRPRRVSGPRRIEPRSDAPRAATPETGAPRILVAARRNAPPGPIEAAVLATGAELRRVAVEEALEEALETYPDGVVVHADAAAAAALANALEIPVLAIASTRDAVHLADAVGGLVREARVARRARPGRDDAPSDLPLDGARLVVIGRRPVRVDRLVDALRARGAAVSVAEPSGVGLDAARLLDPQAILVDASARAEGLTRLLASDPILRWASVLPFRWNVSDDRCGRLRLAPVVERLSSNVRAEAALRRRVASCPVVHVTLDLLGPARLCRALARLSGLLRVEIVAQGQRGELELASSRLVGARWWHEGDRDPRFSDLTALAAFLAVDDAWVRITHGTLRPVGAPIGVPMLDALTEAKGLAEGIEHLVPTRPRIRLSAVELEPGPSARSAPDAREAREPPAREPAASIPAIAGPARADSWPLLLGIAVVLLAVLVSGLAGAMIAVFQRDAAPVARTPAREDLAAAAVAEAARAPGAPPTSEALAPDGLATLEPAAIAPAMIELVTDALDPPAPTTAAPPVAAASATYARAVAAPAGIAEAERGAEPEASDAPRGLAERAIVRSPVAAPSAPSAPSAPTAAAEVTSPAWAHDALGPLSLLIAARQGYPRDPRAARARSDALLARAGEGPAASRELLHQAFVTAPNNPHVAVAIARHHLAADRHDLALAWARWAQRQRRQSPRYRALVTEVLLAMGRREEARATREAEPLPPADEPPPEAPAP
ncbi:MAG: hypothetical protein KF729_10695 [Sandaracinaceae bacterium]|nr:hypothetical protein [Sandaracinaceae bacterium]